MIENKFKWTEETVEKLKKYYLVEKLSSVEIADKLGITKNAVIGKIHRLELNKTITKGKDKSKEITYEKGEYPLSKIGNNMCCWPYGDDDIFTFCGEKVIEGASYCEEHIQEVYLIHKVKEDPISDE